MKKTVTLLLIFLLLFPVFSLGRSKQLWVIDAGHGGHDVGCEGNKTKEKYITLAVALRVAELVKSNIKGVKVRLTRDSDKFLSLEQRSHVANDNNADLFLSIHVNACPDANNVRGTETYYGPIGATNSALVEEARRQYSVKSELLAWEMQKQYGLAGRPISRGIKRERYYVVLYTRTPAILTEVGFISTPSEQDYMMSAAGTEEIAQCIYRGLKEYKEIVDAGNEKSALAQMRRTGGKPSKAELLAFNKGTTTPPPPPPPASATTQATTSKATTTATATSTASAANAASATTTAATTTVAVTPIKNAAAQQAELDATVEPEEEGGDLSFSVQIFALSKKLPKNDSRLKGLKNVELFKKDGKYKYLYGKTADYAVARTELQKVRQLIPDAFLVAFLGTRQISTADAQELYIKK